MRSLQMRISLHARSHVMPWNLPAPRRSSARERNKCVKPACRDALQAAFCSFAALRLARRILQVSYTPACRLQRRFCFIALGRLAVPSPTARCVLRTHSSRFQLSSIKRFLFASRTSGKSAKSDAADPVAGCARKACAEILSCRLCDGFARRICT